jgi:cyclopropane fatty-acyl-phospholipid synthase-like methyltransferase
MMLRFPQKTNLFLPANRFNSVMAKPFSQACENNKEPIRQVLSRWLTGPASVLEVGSGTGQHAVYFAEQFPQLDWQPADLAESLAGIQQWLDEAGLDNVRPPVKLDVCQETWSASSFDAIYSANTVHIMAWNIATKFLQRLPAYLDSGGLFFLYGPFNYDGQYTSNSNARFDTWLAQQNPVSAIRDFEKVNALLESAGMCLKEDNTMPANNRMIVWQKE